jgi:uncharacterized protein YndB with AHSA1/START domain
MEANNNTAEREIVTERVFDAPREMVFKAFTDAEHIAKWWGPDGFTNTVHEMDVRVGGVWRFMMHGPDGTDYPNKIVYVEVKGPERLVFEHSDDEGNGAFLTIIEFKELEPKKTHLKMIARFASVEEREAVMQYAPEGGRQTLNRLAEYLASNAKE